MRWNVGLRPLSGKKPVKHFYLAIYFIFVLKDGPPQTKLSGSTHALRMTLLTIDKNTLNYRPAKFILRQYVNISSLDAVNIKLKEKWHIIKILNIGMIWVTLEMHFDQCKWFMTYPIYANVSNKLTGRDHHFLMMQ